jgi:hypothetical protein
VLIHGNASFPWPPPHGYVESIRTNLERFGGMSLDNGRIWNWWLRDFMWRVPIEVAVERVVAWPDLVCAGDATVYGEPLPVDPPPSQPPPKNGTGPRINHRRAARRARRQPNVLLGWVGADGYPMVVPVEVANAGADGIALSARPGLVPSGSRRAGLTAHTFGRYTHGQTLRKHTGWMTVSPDETAVTYAPHTGSGYWFPASKRLFFIVAGAGTRLGARGARRTGFLTKEPHA